jgi:hypothetical protein
MKRHHGVSAAVVVLLALGWALWPVEKAPVSASPEPPKVAVAEVPKGAAMRSARGDSFPSAVITPKKEVPCVQGRVVDAVTGAGVPGALVVLATSRGALQTQSGSDGAFNFTVAEEGNVAIAEVSAPDYFPFLPRWGHSAIELTLRAGMCVTELVLTLTPHAQYRGVVLGPDGEPVGGASVTLATEDEPPGAPMISAADGTFSFAAQEGAVLVARHPKFSPGAATVDYRVGVTRELVIKLGALGADAGVLRATLKGVVIDARDAGMPGAQVRAFQRVSEEADGRLEAEAETDGQGEFTFDVDGPGPWSVFAVVPGVLSPSVTTAGEPVVLRVLAGTELRGRVSDSSGRAVQSFSVMIGHRDGPLRLESEDVRHVVDPEGKFSIKGLAPGTAEVVVAALGFAPSDPVEVELQLTVPASVDVKLRGGAKVVGQVIDRTTKAPIVGARVSLESQSDSTLNAMPSARSDADGGFVLGSVRPGRRSIFFTAEQHHARLVSVETREGETAGPLIIDLGAIAKGEDPRLELVGIGAVLEAKGDALMIKQALPGGGAAEAGLIAGDGILFIEGESVLKLGFSGGIESIRGPEGTDVKLEIRRADGTVSSVVVPRRRLER